MTVGEALRSAADLSRGGDADATPWDARVLLAHALGGSNPLGLDSRRELEPAAAERFRRLWEERLSGVPVQHLVGEWDFFGRPFRVDGRGLVPRPETEVLITEALREAPTFRRALDAGTGSGILALTLLLERPGSTAVALDASPPALALARANARRHGLLGRLSIVGSDWLTALSGTRFDLVVSNPPYLTLAGEEGLSPTVRDHDPRMALFSGEDGLAAIRRLLDEVPEYLEPGAPFLFEIGFRQSGLVEREVATRPWDLLRIQPDLSGIPRIVVLRRRLVQPGPPSPPLRIDRG